jgi:hypothetical protein
VQRFESEFGLDVGCDVQSDGYRYLMIHSVATILLLITLTLAALQFADWLLAPPAYLVEHTGSMQSND